MHTPSWQWPTDHGAVAEAATELEHLGFGAVWIGASRADLLLHELILRSTTHLTVVTSIVNVWTEAVGEVASRSHRLLEDHPDRFVLGLGAGHPDSAASRGLAYHRPLARLSAYLDELDASEHSVAPGRRVLAALGPRALALAADRAAGAHPYLTTPGHTAEARRLIGPGPLLAPEQAVLFESDPAVARSLARAAIGPYLRLPNYVNSWRRIGFAPEDVAGGGSDELVDSLIAWGDGHSALSAVREHVDAGADHVAVQVLSRADAGRPITEWTLPVSDWARAAAELRGLLGPAATGRDQPAR